MHLNGNFFEKLIFLILLKPKKLFSLDMFNLVPINKFQRSRLTFVLSNLILNAFIWGKSQDGFILSTKCQADL